MRRALRALHRGGGARRRRQRLAPAAGVMVQAVWFDAGARAGRAAAADDPSSGGGRGVVADPGAGPCGGLGRSVAARAGRRAAAARGTSFRGWAQRLAAHAQDAGRCAASFRSGAGCWASRRCCWLTAQLDPARDTVGTAGHLTLTLPAAVTQALLTRVPAAFHGGINDVLLTGLALAVADWCRRHVRWRWAGGAGHAGPAARRCCWMWRVTAARRCSAGVDLSRTVGWFTSLYPVRLDPGGLDLDEALAGGAALGRALKTIKEQLRAVPEQGAGLWAAALSQRADGGGSWPGSAAPQLGFNYLGRFAAAAAARTGRRRPRSWSGALGGGDPAMPLAHCIEINALTLRWGGRRGADGALDVCAGAAGRARRCAIWRRAGSGRWRRWCGMPAQPGAGGPQPERSAAGGAVAGRDRAAGARSTRRIEDILPLSPLQEGLLFHALYDARAPDVYTVQLELGA